MTHWFLFSDLTGSDSLDNIINLMIFCVYHRSLDIMLLKKDIASCFCFKFFPSPLPSTLSTFSMQRKSLRRTGLYSVLLRMKGLTSVNSSFYWRKWTFYLIERKKLTHPHSFKWWLAFSHTWKTVFVLFFPSALEKSKSMLEMHRRVINLNASWVLWAWLKEVPQ